MSSYNWVPTLDWVPRFDRRSNNYRINPPQRLTLNNIRWECRRHLNQGSEGACVGFGITHAYDAKPIPHRKGANAARTLYRQAKQIDEWEGENYEGTSVLAGLRAAKEVNWIWRYEWAFTFDDFIKGLLQGPMIIGVNWYEDMLTPDNWGFIHPKGTLVGGHCVAVRGIVGANTSTTAALIRNSWGRSWGKRGDCYILFEDLRKLLNENGEAAQIVEPPR